MLIVYFENPRVFGVCINFFNRLVAVRCIYGISKITFKHYFLKIFFQYAEYGCEEVPRVADREFHHRICPLKDVPCPLVGCMWLGRKGDLCGHGRAMHGVNLTSILGPGGVMVIYS